MSNISELYLASYQPSSFYISSRSTQGVWYVQRAGSKYTIYPQKGGSVSPWLPNSKNPPKLTVSTLLDLLRNTDVIITDSRGVLAVNQPGRPPEVDELLLEVLSHPNTNLISLRTALESDLKKVTEEAEVYFGSKGNEVRTYISKGSKKYVKVQNISLTLRVTDKSKDISAGVYYDIEVLPFKQNALQVKFTTYSVSSESIKLQEEIHEWLIKTLKSKGYWIY